MSTTWQHPEVVAMAATINERCPSMTYGELYRLAIRFHAEGYRKRPAPSAGPRVIAQAPTGRVRTRRRERRPGTTRRRSSARSGDSGSDEPAAPPRPEGRVAWAWFHTFTAEGLS